MENKRLIVIFFFFTVWVSPFHLVFGQSLSRKQVGEIRRSFLDSSVQITAERSRSEPKKTAGPLSIWRERAWQAAIAGSAADFTVSAARIDGMRIREANPLFRKNGGEFAWGRNLAFSGGILAAEYLIWRKHPRRARRLMWLTAGLRGGVAVYGLSIRK